MKDQTHRTDPVPIKIRTETKFAMDPRSSRNSRKVRKDQAEGAAAALVAQATVLAAPAGPEALVAPEALAAPVAILLRKDLEPIMMTMITNRKTISRMLSGKVSNFRTEDTINYVI